MDTVIETTVETTAKITHAWHVADTHTAAEIADVVLVARNSGYVRNLERASFRDEMYAHQRELKAAYRNAYKVEMCLGQAVAMGYKWELAK